MSVRAFTPTDGPCPSVGATIELDDEESRYLVKVRRLRSGDVFELLDGRGGLWSATLRGADRRARVEVGAALVRPEAPTRVVLLGLPDQPATLEALTGASELGATAVVFVACERSQGRVPPSGRLERVLRAAQRQCGRPRPVELIGGDAPVTLAQALALRVELPGVFAWEALHDRPNQADQRADLHRRGLGDLDAGLRLLVGPEGGLTPAEVGAIGEAGFEAVRLGPWILRTPTAVVAMLARFA